MDAMNLDSLSAAVAVHGPAVLTVHSNGVFYNGKSRLLANDDNGLWVETPACLIPLLQTIQGQSIVVHVSFRLNIGSFTFAAPLLLHSNDFRSNNSAAVSALLLMVPPMLAASIKRQSYRVTVFDQTRLQPKVWKIPHGAVLRDHPAPSAELKARVHDLSSDGACLIVHPRAGQAPTIEKDQRFRISFTHQNEELLLDGRARYGLLLPDDSIRVGLQFKRLETDIKSRQSIARLNQVLGELQRDEARLIKKMEQAVAA